MTHSKIVFHTQSPQMRGKYIVFCVLLVLFSSISLFQSHVVLAANKSRVITDRSLTGYCNNPSPHCYANDYWYGHTPGGFTELSPYGSLNCQGCGTYGFITSEMWFSDDTSSQCRAVGSCWVETGLSTYAAAHPRNCNKGHDSTCLYWADNRPGAGGYHEHPLYTFGGYGANLNPYYVDLTIDNAYANSSIGDTWNVSAIVYTATSTVAITSGQSANNQMNADGVTIGSEVSDTHASTNGNTYYNYNQSKATNGTWLYQPVAGQNTSTNPPPYGSWSVTPCKCSGNTGGSYVTHD